MRHNTYSRLGCIGQPTLVLSGLQDVLIPPENSLTLARRIRGARVKVFEGAGHGFTTQYAAEVAETAAEFLLQQ
jgi:pimeloyl-ACP methyl ester carboxylesterase